jgi:hypothetical protein
VNNAHVNNGHVNNVKSRAPPRGDKEVSFTPVGRTSVPAVKVDKLSTFSLAAGRPVAARLHDALKRGQILPPFGRRSVGGASGGGTVGTDDEDNLSSESDNRGASGGGGWNRWNGNDGFGDFSSVPHGSITHAVQRRNIPRSRIRPRKRGKIFPFFGGWFRPVGIIPAGRVFFLIGIACGCSGTALHNGGDL